MDIRVDLDQLPTLFNQSDTYVESQIFRGCISTPSNWKADLDRLLAQRGFTHDQLRSIQGEKVVGIDANAPPRLWALLGLAYKNGYIFEKSPEKGLECLKKAAAKGDVMGQFHLGRFYEDGIGGVKRNDIRAY